MKKKYVIREPEQLETLADAGSWTASNCTVSSVTNYLKESEYSIKMDCTSTVSYITKTVNHNLRKKAPVTIWVYYNKIDEVSKIQIMLSNDSSFTNYFSFSSTDVHNGWNKITIGRTMWIKNGSPSWGSNIVRIRLRAESPTGANPTVYWSGLSVNGYTRPKVLITMDDQWLTQYTECFPLLKKYGIKGTMYICTDRVGGSEDFVNLAQLREMYNYGMELCCHTKLHISLPTQTYAEQYDAINSSREYLRRHKLTRNNSEMHFAYPFGEYNQITLDVLRDLNFLTARTVRHQTQPHDIDNQYLLHTESHWHEQTQSEWRYYIDRAIDTGNAVEINYHKFVASNPDDTITVLISSFEDMLKYIVKNRNKIDVVTKTEWYNGISNYRRKIN